MSSGQVLFSWNSAGKLTGIQWQPSPPSENPLTLRFSGRQLSFVGFQLVEEFQAYFEEGLPLSFSGWDSLETSALSEFQRKVYEATLHIPHGETRTYAWVAERLGRPMAHRAVGGALRANPFPVLIPCHRVVSSQGGLGGFMGKVDPEQPELVFKKFLLDLEHRYLNPVFGFLAG